MSTKTLEALDAFAREHGRRWRGTLRRLWRAADRGAIVEEDQTEDMRVLLSLRHDALFNQVLLDCIDIGDLK